MRVVHRRVVVSTDPVPERGDVYEDRLAATDPSPFAVARRRAEAATGVAMDGWIGRYHWIRAWHHDLMLIEAGQRGVLPATLAAELGRALRNEAARVGRGRRSAH